MSAMKRSLGVVTALELSVGLVLAPTAADAKKKPKGKRKTTPTTLVVATTTTTAPCPGTAAVAVGNTGFLPKCATVAAGSTVTWTWADASLGHSVTSDTAEPFDSGVQNSGTFEHTFANPGTYAYYCTVHGRALHAGSITVT